MESETKSHLTAMETARRFLNAVPNSNQNEDFKVILRLVEKYLNTHCNECNHNIIEDLIDIDPDRSKVIKYCNLCYTTFNIENA